MGEFYAFCLEFYELSTNQSECKWQSGMAVDKVWHCKVSGPGICVLHPNPNFDPDPRDHKTPHLPRPSSIQKKCIIFFFFFFGRRTQTFRAILSAFLLCLQIMTFENRQLIYKSLIDML